MDKWPARVEQIVYLEGCILGQQQNWPCLLKMMQLWRSIWQILLLKMHVTSTGGVWQVWHLSPSNTSLDTKHMTPNTTFFEVLIINSMMLYSSFFTFIWFICDFCSKNCSQTSINPKPKPFQKRLKKNHISPHPNDLENDLRSTSAQTLEAMSSLPGRQNTDMKIHMHYT